MNPSSVLSSFIGSFTFMDTLPILRTSTRTSVLLFTQMPLTVWVVFGRRISPPTRSSISAPVPRPLSMTV